VGETHATRERVVVQLKKNISSEAERHRQPHLLRIQRYLLSLFPTAHVTSGTSTAEHDTITMRGVVQWTADQMRHDDRGLEQQRYRPHAKQGLEDHYA